MQIQNIEKFNAVVEAAKAKAAGNKRWIAAIEKAADAIINGKWIITELRNCLAITTESDKTYFANGHCQCEAFFRNQPCKHRAAARLIEKYNETAPVAVSPADDRAELIAEIESAWSRHCRGENLADALMLRFGCNNLSMLATGWLRDILAVIA